MAGSRLSISIAGTISSDKQLDELVSGANAVLLDVIGREGTSLRTDWSLRKDEKNSALVILKLRNHTGEIEVKFAPDELKNPRERLHKAWGQLLAKSSP